jgi:hypothetical protein
MLGGNRSLKNATLIKVMFFGARYMILDLKAVHEHTNSA